jgi:molybdenum cofactor synthesis domain-containing protein
MPTAAIAVIGDEILSGKYADENAPFLIGRLRAIGCDLRRIVTLPDEPEVLADELRRLLGFDHVLTSGGVGPTHDDRTFEGVAGALGVPLELHPGLLALLDRSGLAQTETNRRMCLVPRGAELVYGRSRFPVVRARNVWVFPGVPSLLRKKFDDVAEHFAGVPISTARRVTSGRELDVSAGLTAVSARFPGVAIGSYPRWDGDGTRERELVLTLESRDEAALAAAVAAIDDLLAAG